MGGRPGGVGTVTRGRVEVVAAGSDCWAGCRGLYKLSCHGSLALVNEEGKASGAYMGGAYTDRAYVGKAYADRDCADKAYVDEAYIGRACIDGACVGKAYIDRAAY